jgi:hypothetical protein
VGDRSQVKLIGDERMTPDYLTAIFHWRNHAGDLDDPQAPESLGTLLYGCERWLEINAISIDTDEGRRLMMIKLELENMLGRQNDSPTSMLF